MFDSQRPIEERRPAPSEATILSWLERVARVSDERLAGPSLDRELSELLSTYADFVRVSKARRRVTAAADGIAFFISVAQAEGLAIDDDLLDVASAFELYGLSLTLFDAVGDDELEPPFSLLPPAVVTNAALVLFLLGTSGLSAAASGSPAGASIRSIFLEQSLVAGSAQHCDLVGRRATCLTDALDQARGKTSLHAMVAEVAARLAGATEARAVSYRRMGQAAATMRQIGNDLRDLFAVQTSGDLRLRRQTVPIAIHRLEADADARRALDELLAEDPPSEERVRACLLASGAVLRAAELMEKSRREIHRIARELDVATGPLAPFLGFVDGLAAKLYRRGGVGSAS
ncbi:MAG: hypothetical protein U0271_31570 [Polyangiaceae bacterium]